MKKNNPRWTEDEDNELAEMAGKFSKEDMAAHFNRTVKAIQSRAYWLGLSIGFNRHPKSWTTTDINAIKRWNAEGLNWRQIAAKIDRTHESLRLTMFRLGIKRNF